MLAVNALTELPIDEYDIEDALYDHSTDYLSRILSGAKVLPQRTEGAFISHGRIIDTRISAILFTRATPTNLFQVPYWIYHDPKASFPLKLHDLPLNSHDVSVNGVQIIIKKSIGELLGLPDSWPGEKLQWQIYSQTLNYLPAKRFRSLIKWFEIFSHWGYIRERGFN